MFYAFFPFMILAILIIAILPYRWKQAFYGKKWYPDRKAKE